MISEAEYQGGKNKKVRQDPNTDVTLMKVDKIQHPLKKKKIEDKQDQDERPFHEIWKKKPPPNTVVKKKNKTNKKLFEFSLWGDAKRNCKEVKTRIPKKKKIYINPSR